MYYSNKSIYLKDLKNCSTGYFGCALNENDAVEIITNTDLKIMGTLHYTSAINILKPHEFVEKKQKRWFKIRLVYIVLQYILNNDGIEKPKCRAREQAIFIVTV